MSAQIRISGQTEKRLREWQKTNYLLESLSLTQLAEAAIRAYTAEATIPQEPQPAPYRECLTATPAEVKPSRRGTKKKG
jgi:hypothetical protein